MSLSLSLIAFPFSHSIISRPHWMSTSVTNLKYESAKYESSPGDPYNLFATQSKSSVARSVQTIQAPQTHESAQVSPTLSFLSCESLINQSYHCGVGSNLSNIRPYHLRKACPWISIYGRPTRPIMWSQSPCMTTIPREMYHQVFWFWVLGGHSSQSDRNCSVVDCPEIMFLSWSTRQIE